MRCVMRRGEGRYIVAGTDLSAVLARWLEDVEAASIGHHLYELATDPDELSAAVFGRRFLMGQIAPRVWGDRGSHEELLLYAVLTVGAPRAGVPFAGIRKTVEGLFTRFHDLGEEEVGRRLRAEVSERAGRLVEPHGARRRWPVGVHWSLNDEPGRIAAYEQEMAKATHRDLRAAQALAPVDEPWMPADAAP